MKKYYVYFITPEADSKFVTFGRTFNLGSRWVSYRNQTPDPKIVGLIECKSENDMLSLEYQIRHHDFQGAAHRDEWLYHTPEVKAFYEARTNVNIEEHLSDAIERQLQHRRAYRQRPDVKKRRRQRKREYRQRPDVKERRQRSDVKERQREYQQRPDVKKRRRERLKKESPEAKERRLEYQREYQREYQQRPDVKKRRREYQQRPDVKKRQREYNQRYEAKKK